MGNTFEIRSLLNFLALTIFATAAAIFLIHKGNEAAAEIDRLNDGPLKMHRATLIERLEIRNCVRYAPQSKSKTC